MSYNIQTQLASAKTALADVSDVEVSDAIVDLKTNRNNYTSIVGTYTHQLSERWAPTRQDWIQSLFKEISRIFRRRPSIPNFFSEA